MIPSNFKIEILPIRALLCAIGSKGLKIMNTGHSVAICLTSLNFLFSGQMICLTKGPEVSIHRGHIIPKPGPGRRMTEAS